MSIEDQVHNIEVNCRAWNASRAWNKTNARAFINQVGLCGG